MMISIVLVMLLLLLLNISPSYTTMNWAPLGNIKKPFITFFNDVDNPSLKTTNVITKQKYFNFPPSLQLPQDIPFSIFCGVCIFKESRAFENSNFTIEISNYKYKSKIVKIHKKIVHRVGLNKCKILYMVTEPLDGKEEGGEISCTFVASQTQTYKQILPFEISSHHSPPIHSSYYHLDDVQRELFCSGNEKKKEERGEGKKKKILITTPNFAATSTTYLSSIPTIINVWSINNSNLVIESMKTSISIYDKLFKFNNLDDDHHHPQVVEITCSTFNPFNLGEIKQVHHYVHVKKKYIINSAQKNINDMNNILITIILFFLLL